MKALLSIFVAVAWFAIPAFAGSGSEYIIKQRAKELSNQNNVRQGVQAPAPQQPSAPQTPAVTAPPQTPQQQALARLQASISAIRPESATTPQKTQQLARDLTGAAFGPARPSPGTISKLAESLSGALSQKLLSNPTRNRLVQDLNAVLNPAKISKSQIDDVIADIQAIFQSNGIERKEAAAIGARAAAVVAETKQTAANK